MEDKKFKNKSFLGRGWSFPPTFDMNKSTGIQMVENENDIRQSLEILFNTNLGERIMLPEYGCDLQKYIFDSISNSEVHFLRELIRSAILRYEPRISINEISFDLDGNFDGIIKINVDYTIQLTNTRFNLVFPYYKDEGTDLPQLYHSQISQNQINE